MIGSLKSRPKPERRHRRARRATQTHRPLRWPWPWAVAIASCGVSTLESALFWRLRHTIAVGVLVHRGRQIDRCRWCRGRCWEGPARANEPMLERRRRLAEASSPPGDATQREGRLARGRSFAAKIGDNGGGMSMEKQSRKAGVFG